MSAHLSFVDARGGCGVVLVVTPRRMMEMDDEIAVVRNDRPVEGDGSDAAPIPEGAPLAEERAVRLPIIGDLDVEGERALRPGVAAVVNLRSATGDGRGASRGSRSNSAPRSRRGCRCGNSRSGRCL